MMKAIDEAVRHGAMLGLRRLAAREERAMGFISGVHLLPATGEFTYDTIAYQGQRLGGAMLADQHFLCAGGSDTDYSIAIDQLQAAHPECATVSIVCAWFGERRNRRLLPDLSVDDLYRRVVPAALGRRRGSPTSGWSRA